MLCQINYYHTIPYHYTIFLVVKLDLCIRTLFLGYILALKKNTRMPSVHLFIMCTQKSNKKHVIVYLYNYVGESG